MKPLQEATISLESVLECRLDLKTKSPQWWADALKEPVEKFTPEYIEEVIEKEFARCRAAKVWKNEIYTVHVTEEPNSGVTELSIRRNDRKPITDWRHKQQIKNQLCGEEREGIELYPAESRCVDTANQYYIFVMPDGVKIPFGFQTRLKSEDNVGRSQQRKFNE